MLLAIDVGNTQTAIGLWRGSTLIEHWRISTNAERTADEYRLLLTALLGGHIPTGAALASVVPPVTTSLRTTLERLVDGALVVVGPGTRTGMAIHIDTPRELGADRIVNAIGAADRYGAPVVVVDFGTATTVDLVGEGGDYLGGAIAPGLSVAADALVEHTAALRRVELTTPRSVVGRSTVEAIQSGLVFGYAGLVDGLVGRMLEAHPQAATVATGGVAALVVPHCKLVSTVDENLTLFGLSLVFQLNVA